MPTMTLKAQLMRNLNLIIFETRLKFTKNTRLKDHLRELQLAYMYSNLSLLYSLKHLIYLHPFAT